MIEICIVYFLPDWQKKLFYSLKVPKSSAYVKN